MQIYVIQVFVLSILLLGFLIKYKFVSNRIMSLTIVLILVMLGLHMILENTMWQIYPLYISIAILISTGVFSIFKYSKFQSIRKTRVFILLLSGFLILLSGIASFVFPVYDMPTPNGDFSIGTESFVLTDNDRQETYAEVGNRKIKIQLWYPTDTTQGYDLQPWLEDGKLVAEGLATDFGLPSFILDHTELIPSNSYVNAPISDSSTEYPVVIISHGWRGFRNIHTDLAEELASLGYIVIGIDHTYGSVATVFSEDEVAYVNLEALPETETQEEFLEYANVLVNTYADDISFTLNEIERMNTGAITSRFEGKFDLTSVGLLGHSTGGGADVAVAINDVRIKALIGMDAWVEPIYETEIVKGLNMPSLFLRSGSWETGDNNINLLNLIENSNDSSLLYQIDGTIHYDFSMAYMYSPLTKALNLTGDLDGDYLVPMLKEMIVSFFDENLKGTGNTDLNNMDTLWDEVRKID